MRIHPEEGYLPSGETAVCVLTFTADDHPKCYQLDVICQVQHYSTIIHVRYHLLNVASVSLIISFCLQIIPETVMTQYLEALQLWEKAREQHDFIGTDKKPSLNTSEKVICVFSDF